MSPRKKRMKKMQKNNKLKRSNEGDETPSKRMKTRSKEAEYQAMIKKNFVSACEQVSYKSYCNQLSRLLLLYTPPCIKDGVCKHHDSKAGTISKVMPGHAEESFKIETKTKMWLEALEVCQLCITPTQYLSANVLKEVVEIILNSHEDDFGGYTIKSLVGKCQQILSHNFFTHPPCLEKALRECYSEFLFSPMDPKDLTFTNRDKFECRKGIVKYCFKRLEYELSSESIDGPLLDKYENVPKEMQQTIQGLHWQKEKFEIFEMLNRPERIERLMAVLESIIELLQLDLAIWHSRYTNDITCHVKRSHKPLMAILLWSDEHLYTGGVNYNCRLILGLFVNMVHLKYPNEHIKTMMTWLNAMVQTIYLCEENSNKDYPNVGGFCNKFANEFYKIISEKPQESILRILEHIQPTYMQHLTALLHVQNLLPTSEKCIIEILIKFINETHWKEFNESDREIQFSKKLFIKPKREQNKLKYLSKKCCKWLNIAPICYEKPLYPKIGSGPDECAGTDLNMIVHAMFITLESYLDAYSVQSFLETREMLNKNLQGCDIETSMQNMELESLYSVSEGFVKKYRDIFCTKLKEFVLAFRNVETSKLPHVMNIFKKIDFLDL